MASRGDKSTGWCGGYPAHCLNRRGFLQQCGATLTAGALGAAAMPSAAAGEAAAEKKVRVGLVFICYPPGQPVWPYVDFDYDARKRELNRQLKQGCPKLEFVPLSLQGAAGEEIPRVKKLAQDVDGLLIIPLCTHWGLTSQLLPVVAKLDKPTVVADEPYSGSGVFLCYYAAMHRAGSKAVGVSSCRLQDLVDVVNCFGMLARPGTTVEAFAAEAERVKRAGFAKPGEMTCKDDPVKVANVGKALAAVRKDKMLVVGRGARPFELLGVPIQPVGFEEINAIYQKVDREEATRWADRWADEAQEVVEPAKEDLRKSAAIYLAMEDLMKKHDAQGVTINCLGGFYGGHLPGYPCLGYRQLNNDGVRMGTCEAMPDDLLMQLICKHLLGRPGFASDPVLDTSTNQIIYAHCVAPTKMFGPQGPVNPFRIRSHAEDGKGASVQSLLPLGYMTTTFDIRPSSKEMVTHQGKAVANVDEARACRTKLAAEVKGDIGRLFHEWDRFGWHRVTVYGNVQEPIEAMGKAMGLSIVREA